MPNGKGWLTKEEVKETGLPCYHKKIWDGKEAGWSHEPYPYAALLTRTRCKQLGMPALRTGSEAPSAYLYINATSDKYRFVPLFDRTDVFESGELSWDVLQPHEKMGEIPNAK